MFERKSYETRCGLVLRKCAQLFSALGLRSTRDLECQALSCSFKNSQPQAIYSWVDLSHTMELVHSKPSFLVHSTMIHCSGHCTPLSPSVFSIYSDAKTLVPFLLRNFHLYLYPTKEWLKRRKKNPPTPIPSPFIGKNSGSLPKLYTFQRKTHRETTRTETPIENYSQPEEFERRK